MQNITLEDLDLVYGGTGVVTPTPTSNLTSGTATGSSAACGGNDALLTSLNSIGSSIKDLSHKNNGGFGGDSTMLMLGMALAMRRNDDGGGNTIVVNGGGGGCGHGGFSARGRW